MSFLTASRDCLIILTESLTRFVSLTSCFFYPCRRLTKNWKRFRYTQIDELSFMILTHNILNERPVYELSFIPVCHGARRFDRRSQQIAS
eukprot:3624887-Pleurochrysis_carterae.AAC.8